MMERDVLIIGGGPAGMAAALSAKQSGCGSVLLAERSETLGGILNQCVHSGFGLTYFGEELTGPEYAERFMRKIDDAHIEHLTNVMAISLRADGVALLSGAACGLLEIRAKTVILATGCRERPIGALPVTGARPSGIFTAGSAQKMVNLGGYDIGDRFIILGSGDVGLIMARQLTLLGKTVLSVLEKDDRCGGLERNKRSCLDDYGIPLMTRTTVTRIHGSARIEGVTVLDLDSGAKSFAACDTLITAVGLIPERDLIDEIAADGALPDWLFLCGNACTVHDLVDDVTLEGAYVGQEAARFVQEGVRTDASISPSTHEADAYEGIICVACPKSCRLIKTADGYEGALCGRKDPIPSR